MYLFITLTVSGMFMTFFDKLTVPISNYCTNVSGFSSKYCRTSTTSLFKTKSLLGVRIMILSVVDIVVHHSEPIIKFKILHIYNVYMYILLKIIDGPVQHN